MPCNAIATAQARINVEAATRQLVTPAIFGTVIAAIYKNQEGAQPVVTVGQDSVSVRTNMLRITYTQSTGDLRISVVGYPTNSQDVIDQAKTLILATLKTVTGALLQERVKALLRAKGARIESEQRAANGALVLTVDL